MEIFLARSWMLALVLAPALAQAQSFGSWYNHQIESGRLEALKLSPPPETGETEKIKSAQSKIFDLYRKHLPAGVKIDAWEAAKLPRALQMPAAEPTPGYYNTHILWALKGGKRVMGFRPVNTSTGCSSGCLPVVFHLALSPDGKVTQIIEEADRPLTKLNHVPFSDEDRKKALEIAQKLPEGLRDIDGPTDLTDDTPYPAQTWTVLKPMLVPNAAYTSYRIYEAALKSLESLNAADNSAAVEKERDILTAALQSDASKSTEAIQKLLSVASDTSLPSEARRTALRLLPAMVLWQIETPAKDTDPLKLARAVFARPEFRSSRLRSYCHFKTKLADSEPGLVVLAQIVREPQNWPFCSAESDAALAYLAGQSPKGASAPPVPNFALQSPNLLMAYAEASRKAGHETEARKSLAEVQVRFPNFKTPPTPLKVTESDLKEAEANYRNELRRELVPATTLFPKFDIDGGKKLNTRGKRVFFVFAAWCPHCQHTFAELGRRQIPANLLTRWQFIEAFAHPGSSLEGRTLCHDSKLPKMLCKNLVRTVDTSNNKELFKQLSLFTIPRIFVTDAKGRVSAFDFKMDFREGRDALRDLNWLLQEIDR